MCVNPLHLPIKVCNKVVGFREVSCGKCHECLNRMSTSYQQKYYREAMYRGSMHFFTLTYDNEHIHLRCGYVNDYGDFNGFVSPLDFKLVSEQKQEIRSKYFDSDISSLHEPIIIQSSFGDIVACPSLLRYHVQRWLKEYRKINKDVNFSYSFIGEYGKQGRPHYHGAVFGLNDKQADDLKRLWKYGFTLVKSVNLLPNNGKSDVAQVAKYIAKYMHKGSFENMHIPSCLHETPRVISSLHLGEGDNFADLVSWFRGLDRFPNTSIHDASFSDDHLALIEQRIKQFAVGTKNQRLSPAFYKKIFNYEYTNPLTKKTYLKASNLSLAIVARLQTKSRANFETEYNKLKEKSLQGQEVSSDLKRLLDSEQIVCEDREKNHKRLYAQFLSKSKL